MSITVDHSVTAQVPTGAFTLAELKQIVTEAEKAGLPPGSRVTIDYFRGDQREPSYATITVRAR